MIIFLSLNLNNYLFSIYNMEQKKLDLKLGLSSEKKLLPKFKEIFGNSLEQNNQYDIFDYENENFMIELKTRRIRHNQFYDLQVGLNKLELAFQTKDKISVIVWNCIDGLYYWIPKAKEFSVRMARSTKRGRIEEQLCAFVPRKYIKPLEEFKV